MSRKPSAVVAVCAAICCQSFLLLLCAPLAHAQVDILFNGKVVTGATANNPVQVLIGQPIHLSIGSAGGVQISNIRWLLPWGVVSVTHPTAQTEKVTTLTNCAACYTQPNPTVYWIDKDSTKTVSLGFDLFENGRYIPGTVSATFHTQGPENVAVTTIYNVNKTMDMGMVKGTVALYDDAGNHWVGLGNGTDGNEGITFKVDSKTPAASAGLYEWVQIVHSDLMQYFPPNGVPCTEQSAGGLDLPENAPGYWYGQGPGRIEDSITMELGNPQTYNTVYRQFSAFMYLRWKPYNDGIFVPIGFVSWDTGWTLKWGTKPDKTTGWVVTSSYANASQLAPSLQYPTWTGLSTITGVCKW